MPTTPNTLSDSLDAMASGIAKAGIALRVQLTRCEQQGNSEFAELTRQAISASSFAFAGICHLLQTQLLTQFDRKCEIESVDLTKKAIVAISGLAFLLSLRGRYSDSSELDTALHTHLMLFEQEGNKEGAESTRYAISELLRWRGEPDV